MKLFLGALDIFYLIFGSFKDQSWSNLYFAPGTSAVSYGIVATNVSRFYFYIMNYFGGTCFNVSSTG